MPQVIYTSKKLFQRTLFFSTGGVLSHSICQSPTFKLWVKPPNPTCWSLIYPGSSTSPGGSGGERPGPNLHPTKMRKNLLIMYWHDTYIKHISFFCLLVSYVDGIFMYFPLWWLKKNQKMMVTSKFHMVVLILLVKPYWTVWGLRFLIFFQIFVNIKKSIQAYGPPKHPPKWSFLVGSPWWLGTTILGNPHILRYRLWWMIPPGWSILPLEPGWSMWVFYRWWRWRSPPPKPGWRIFVRGYW